MPLRPILKRLGCRQCCTGRSQQTYSIGWRNIISNVQLETAKANLQRAQGQLAQSKATKSQSQAAYSASMANINFGVVRSPISGVVGAINMREGSLVCLVTPIRLPPCLKPARSLLISPWTKANIFQVSRKDGRQINYSQITESTLGWTHPPQWTHTNTKAKYILLPDRLIPRPEPFNLEPPSPTKRNCWAMAIAA